MSDKRPQPRKSALNDVSAFTPPPYENAESEQPTQSEQPKSRGPEKTKLSFYRSEDETGRLRAALIHTQPYEGVRSMSDLINDAVDAEVQRLENKYNNGQSWPPIPAGQLPRGPSQSRR